VILHIVETEAPDDVVVGLRHIKLCVAVLIVATALAAAGFAAAITESISMGAVGYTSSVSQRDYYQAERARELVTDRLKQEIGTLSEQQSAAQTMAALVGMTINDAEQYKERHNRIKNLKKELAALDGEQGAHHE